MKTGSLEKWHQVVGAEVDFDTIGELMRVVLDNSCADLELVQTTDGLKFRGCGEPEVYVEILHEGTCAEGWGRDLAQIARAMAHQHSNYLETDRDDGDLFAGIVDGFLEEARAQLGQVLLVEQEDDRP